MEQIMKSGDFAVHVAGYKVEKTNTFNIEMFTTYAKATDPNDLNRILQLNLTESELQLLINKLSDIKKIG